MRTAVVIPCFNDGELLPEALESVTRQEACELVIVDDGSTDPATLEVLEGLRDDGFEVLRQENQGLGPARMTGVAATTAPFIHPLDADDRLADGALTALADVLEAAPEAIGAWGSFHSFGATDCHYPTASRLDPWRVTFLNEIPATCMFRRTAFDVYGGWDNLAFEDWDFWMRMAEQGADGVGIPQVTLHYREHSSERLFATMLESHSEHYDYLRSRHEGLFRDRRKHRRRSDSPLGVKLLFPLIDAVPGLAPRRKWQLWGLVRYLFQREAASSCYRGPMERLRGLARKRSGK